MKNYIWAGLLLMFALLGYSCVKNESGQAESQEFKELLWYGIGNEASDIPKVFESVSQNLAEMGRNYSVKYERFGWGDYSQKIQLILASGEPADVVFMASWAGNYVSTAVSGYLSELDELIASQPKLKASLSDDFWNAVRVSGKIYAVPNYKDMAHQEYFAFNRKFLDKYNIKLPENLYLEDIEPLMAQVTEVKVGDYIGYDGILARPARGDYLLGPLMPMMLSFAEPDKGYRVLTEVPEFQKYARLVRKWVDEGYYDKDAYLRKDENAANIKNWFIRNYPGFPGADISLSESWSVPMDVVVFDWPPVLDGSTPLGAMLSIPESSANKQQAIDFISLVNTNADIRNLIGYGIEGVHYNLNAQGQIIRTQQGLDVYNMPNFSLGSLLLLKTLEGEPLDSREDLRIFNEQAEPSPALGFHIDKEPYSQIIAKVTAASEPYFDSVKFGLRPADELLEEWRNKLRELGWFEVVDEINQKYTDWKKSK